MAQYHLDQDMVLSLNLTTTPRLMFCCSPLKVQIVVFILMLSLNYSRWIGSQFNRRRYGDFYGTRLEPANGSTSNGSRSSNWTEENCECLPLDHAEYGGGEDYEFTAIQT